MIYPPYAEWDERLMCRVISLTYDFPGRTGRLHLFEGDCCDMSGCVSLFEGIDPQVAAIHTYSGDRADTLYRKKGTKWYAFEYRSS